MKRVEAIFAPVHLTDVVERLRMIGVFGATLTELRAVAAEPRHMSYRGVEVNNDLEDVVRLEIVMPADHVEGVVNAILLIVRRGKPEGKSDDGWVYVSPVDEAIRIRTGETGRDAL